MIGSQWRAIENRIIGLDMSSVLAILDIYHIKVTSDLLDVVRMIEHKYVKNNREALEEIEKRKS